MADEKPWEQYAAANATPANDKPWEQYSSGPEIDQQPPKPSAAEGVNSAAALYRQFAEGANSGLVGSATQAGARAAGAQPVSSNTQPRSFAEATSRTIGVGLSTAYDFLFAEMGVPEVIAGAKALSAARPVVGPAVSGALYGANQSAASQYADKGQVDAAQLAKDTAIGSVIPGAVGGAVNAVSKAPAAVSSAYDTLARILRGEPAKAKTDALDVVAKGTKEALSTPTDPHVAIAQMLDKQQGAEGVAAQKSIDTQNKAVTKTMTDAGLDTPTDIAKSGNKLQQSLLEGVRTFQEARRVASDPLYEKAAEQAKSKEMAGQMADGSAVKQSIANHAANGEISISGQGQEKAIDKFLFGEDGTQTTYAKLNAAKEQVNERLNTLSPTDPNMAGKRRAYTDLKTNLDGALEKHAPLLKDAKAAYEAHSQELNDLLSSPQVRGAIELQDFTRRDTSLPNLKFQQNPQEVGKAFVDQGADGGTKIRIALGDKADPWVRGHFAGEVQGKNAEQLQKMLAPNSKSGQFLSQFPETRAAIEKVAQAKATQEGLQKQAQEIVSAAAKTGVPVQTAQAKAAVTGWLERFSPKDVSELKAAMTATKRQGGDPSVGRDAVASYFSDKLTPALEAGADKTMGIKQVADNISKTASEWRAKKDVLVEAGIITPQHAKDVGTIIEGLDNFSKAVGKGRRVDDSVDALKSQLHLRLSDILAYESGGYKAVLALRAGRAAFDMRKAYQNSTQKLLMGAIKDGPLAEKLAQAFRKEGSSQNMLGAVLAYGAAQQSGNVQGAQ